MKAGRFPMATDDHASSQPRRLVLQDCSSSLLEDNNVWLDGLLHRLGGWIVGGVSSGDWSLSLWCWRARPS